MRSPEELFKLTVSGLSAVQQYGFTATSTMDGAREKREFRGVVKEHDQLQLLAAGTDGQEWLGQRNADAVRSLNPEGLMSWLLGHKADVTLDESRSNAGTVLLIIRQDPEQAASMWRSRLQDKWQAVRAEQPQNSDVWPRLNDSQRKQFAAEWNAELDSSSAQWRSMMDSLSADSQYELVINRSRLIPISLKEHSQLHYLTGKTASTEVADMDFHFQYSH